EPPQYANDMADDIAAFQQAVPGSEEAAEIGKRIAKNWADNMLMIGTVNAPAPIYVRNGLRNVPEFQTWSYEYYRTYPYRATQWFLAEDN
ncbi:MAG: ABC transporter substrate-binding protein, partial [Roseobacter sp.]